MAKKRAMGEWSILPEGQLVSLTGMFAKSRGFRRGRIVKLLCDPEEATRHGGRYGIRPLDGRDTESVQQLPRSAFVPVKERKAVSP